MTKKNILLWQKMADLTWDKCLKTCRIIGSCCSPEYCKMAMEYAKEQGVTLEPTGNPKMIFLGEKGCTCPPHFRPLCSLHQCQIAGLGFDPKDPKWTYKYFKIREKLDEIMV